MHYVYTLEAIDSDHWYVGVTNNVDRRLEEHNSGESGYTKAHGPWRLKMYVAFPDRNKAEAFEKYLKTQSGRAFTKKYF